MYRDRSVSLNRIMRDIKRHFQTEFVTEMEDGTLLYVPNPPFKITDILLHVPCWEPWYDGKYIARVDEFVIKYTDENNVERTYRRHFRYDCFCDDPDVHSTIAIVYDTQSTEPFIRTTIGQKSIIQHIERYQPTESIEPFWLRVNTEQDSFTPKDRTQPVMYHKLSVAVAFTV